MTAEVLTTEAGFDRPGKNIARSLVFEGLPPAKSVLTMPSTHRLCVEELRTKGVIGDDTRQVWIECDRNIFRALEDVADERTTEVLKVRLEEYEGDERFDLINADTMTTFGQRQALSMESLVNNLNAGGTFILWATGWPRALPAVQFREYLQSRLDDDLSWLRDDVHKGVVEAMERAGFSDGDLYDGESITTSMVATVSLARCAMANYSYRVAVLGAYRDGTPMLVIRFDDVHPLADKPDALPLASDIVDDFNSIYHRPSNSDEALLKEIEAHLGNHKLRLIADGDNPKWVLFSPVGKRMLSSDTLAGIAAKYRK